MNIKTIILSFFLVILITNSQAQDYKVTFGKESSAENGMFPSKILGEYNGGLYILKDKWSTEGRVHYVSLEKYATNDFHLLFSVELEKMPENDNGKRTTFSDIFLLKGKLVLITSYIKNPTAFGGGDGSVKYECYATPVSDQGVIGEKATLIYQDNQLVDFFNVKTCGYVLSSDSTQLLVYAGTVKDGKIRSKIINSDLTVATESNIEMDFKNSYVISNFKLNKNNILFCTAKEELPKSEWFSKDVKKYTNRIMAFDLKNSTYISKTIPVKVNLPLSNFYFEYRDDIIQVVSYYSKGVKHKANSGGLMYYQFKTSNLELLNNFEQEFDKTIFSQLNTNVELPGSNSFDETTNSINTIEGARIIKLKNEENLIISEQIVNLEGSTNHGRAYFNLLITRINKKGEFVQNIVIPKYQAGLTKSIYSFESFYKNNTLFVVFLDNPKNLNLADPYKLEGGIAAIKGTVPVIVSVSEKGEWSKKILFEGEDLPNIYPTTSFFRKGNQLIIYGQKKKDIKFAKINY